MSEVTFRELLEEDWSDILRLAQASLSELSNPPSQQDWLDNRRTFSTQGTQHHFVAVVDGAIVGYAAAERHAKAPLSEYRLFVVVAPTDRFSIGTPMLRELRRDLLNVEARSVRLVEYANDSGFLAYLHEMGFETARTFALADGTPVFEVRMQAPFDALA